MSSINKFTRFEFILLIEMATYFDGCCGENDVTHFYPMCI